MTSENSEKKITLREKIGLSDRGLVLRVEKATELAQDVKDAWTNLSSTFDVRQKRMSTEMNVPEKLDQLFIELDNIKEGQTQIRAEMSKQGRKGLMIGIAGTIIGIVGITLAILALL